MSGTRLSITQPAGAVGIGRLRPWIKIAPKANSDFAPAS
jgi:hypothetical protein